MSSGRRRWPAELKVLTYSLLTQGLRSKPITLPPLGKVLHPYQVLGVSWLKVLHDEGLSAMLADEMGLGKSVQTIALLSLLHKDNPKYLNLVVVPASTLENWSREFRAVAPELKVQVYYGNNRRRLGISG